jgi:hypothetical protein
VMPPVPPPRIKTGKWRADGMALLLEAGQSES